MSIGGKLSKLEQIVGHPITGFSTNGGEYQDCNISTVCVGLGVVELSIQLMDGTKHSVLMDVVGANLLAEFIEIVAAGACVSDEGFNE